MAKKNKKTRTQVPFLKTDLDLDPDIVSRLIAAQKKFSTRFKTQIEDAQKDALIRFSQNIESLTKVKADLNKEINAEIKKYRALVKDLDTIVKKTPAKSTSSTSKKTVAKQTVAKKPVEKKPAVKKTPPKRTPTKKK